MLHLQFREYTLIEYIYFIFYLYRILSKIREGLIWFCDDIYDYKNKFEYIIYNCDISKILNPIINLILGIFFNEYIFLKFIIIIITYGRIIFLYSFIISKIIVHGIILEEDLRKLLKLIGIDENYQDFMINFIDILLNKNRHN